MKIWHCNIIYKMEKDNKQIFMTKIDAYCRENSPKNHTINLNWATGSQPADLHLVHLNANSYSEPNGPSILNKFSSFTLVSQLDTHSYSFKASLSN